MTLYICSPTFTRVCRQLATPHLLLDRMIALSNHSGVAIMTVVDGPYLLGIAMPD